MPGCILGILTLFIFFFISILVSILRVAFGVKQSLNRMKNGQAGPRQRNAKQQTRQDDPFEFNDKRPEKNPRNHQGRFFEKDEGEYVDFEEIK